MHVARGETPRGAGETVRHREHYAFLQSQHIAKPGVLRQGVHNRKLGGAGIPEEVRDPLVLEQSEESGTAGDRVHVR